VEKVPWGIETCPISSEEPMAEAVDVGHVQREATSRSQHTVALLQQRKRVVNVLYYVIHAYFIRRIVSQSGAVEGAVEHVDAASPGDA